VEIYGLWFNGHHRTTSISMISSHTSSLSQALCSINGDCDCMSKTNRVRAINLLLTETVVLHNFQVILQPVAQTWFGGKSLAQLHGPAASFAKTAPHSNACDLKSHGAFTIATFSPKDAQSISSPTNFFPS
jgi:hypothetical protein